MRKLIAEGLGALLLVCVVVGSGIMAESLAGGNVAVALLGNTIATGAILYVLITILADVSGAHFNPAVSFIFWLRGDLSRGLFIGYVLAQCLGGIAGTFLAHFMFEQDLLQFAQHARTGHAKWLAEIVASFGLMLTILGGLRYRPDAVPALVGLYITAGYWFTSSTSFANPAVTIARSLSDSFAGIRPQDVIGFIIAQIIGMSLAYILSKTLFAEAAK